MRQALAERNRYSSLGESLCQYNPLCDLDLGHKSSQSGCQVVHVMISCMDKNLLPWSLFHNCENGSKLLWVFINGLYFFVSQTSSVKDSLYGIGA